MSCDVPRAWLCHLSRELLSPVMLDMQYMTCSTVCAHPYIMCTHFNSFAIRCLQAVRLGLQSC